MFETATLYSLSLVGPLAIIAALALAVPYGISLRLPETMQALGMNLILSALILWGLSAFGMAWAYARQGIPWEVLLSGPGLARFTRLGLLAGLLWAPLMALVLATRPQTWRPEL